MLTAAYKINLHTPSINANALTVSNRIIYLQREKAKVKVEAEALKETKDSETKESEMKDRMLPLLNGFGNGSALGDVRQRMAGAVASQWSPTLTLRIKNLIAPSEYTMCTHINSFNYRVHINLATGDASVLPQSPNKLHLARNVHYFDLKLLVVIDRYYLFVSYYLRYALSCHS